MKTISTYKLTMFCAGVIILASAYSTLNHVGFANVDDPWALLKNPLVTVFGYNISYFKTLAVSFNDLQYSPLNTLYYALIYKINGFDPYYFHLFSLIVHFLNVVLVFILSSQILKIFKIPNAHEISYLTALFWAITPINAEAVVWISASKIVLTTFFLLVATISFLKILTRSTYWYYILVCLLSYIMAFLCKEQAIVLPITLSAFYLCYRSYTKSMVRQKAIIMLFVCFVGLMVAFAMVSLKANTTDKGVLISGYPLYQRAILVCYSIFFYLFSLIIPVGLHFHYPFPMMPGQPLPALYYVFPVLLIMVIVLGYKYLNKLKSNMFYLFCVLAFIINIGLCLHIIPMSRPALLADRYMYIPSIFILLAISTVFMNNVYNNVSLKYQRIILALAVTYLFIMVGYTNILVYNWTNIYLQKI